MGVVTDADRHIDACCEAMDTAIRELSKVVVDQCWGWDDYARKAQKKQRELLSQLILLRGW